MREYLKFYIDGKWVEPTELKTLDVENPALEEVAGKIALGNAKDVDKAVAAAKKAFPSWSQTSREERLEVLGRILAEYQKRFGDLATTVTEEMAPPSRNGPGADRHGAPLHRHRDPQDLQVRGRPRPGDDRQGADRRSAFITPRNWPLDRSSARSPRPSPQAAPWC